MKLFEEIKEGKYEPYTSEYVTDELEAAPEEKRLKMLRLIEDYRIKLIGTSDEAVALSRMYVSEGVVPQKYVTDALHIAIATIMDMDFIVSLNFRHIVKRKTKLMTEVINVREGYKKTGIFSPAEVIENEE